MTFSIDRGRELYRYMYWRWARNFPDSARHLINRQSLSKPSADIVDKLCRDGVMTTNRGPDPELFDELQDTATKVAREVWDDTGNQPRTSRLDRKGDRSSLGPGENKDFLQVLTPDRFDGDSVYLRYALQPEFVAVANTYLRQQSRLRAIHLWLNFPTGGDAASTQLWHRDGDDFMNLKIFTYLTNVGPDNGPFAFIPGTQPLGYRRIRPEGSEFARTNDDQMRQEVPESAWRICAGAAGSVVYADTCGYHKGVKPVSGHRLMLMVHYVSASAVSGSDLKLNQIPGGLFTPHQLAAIGVAA